MSSRSTLTIIVGSLSILGFSACKTVYSDTFSYRKNSFKAPVEKAPDIKVPTVPIVPDGGLMPGVPGPGNPAGGPMPGIPGAEAAPGVPGAPAAPPAVPAVPGL